MPYHPQTNGLVQRLHQTIMHMIGKLGEDKKANWPSHLAEIVHTYNSTQSTVTGYSPHYLMLGWGPRLPVEFIFPTIGSNEAPTRQASARSVDVYVASIRDRLSSTLQVVQAQSAAVAHQQKWYYDKKIGTVNLKPGDLVLVKANAWKERGRSRVGGKKRLGRWCIKSWLMSPLTKWWTNMDGHESSTETDFFFLHQRLLFPCVWATIIHGTGVPAPPQARLLLQEVGKRGYHKRKVARHHPTTYQ